MITYDETFTVTVGRVTVRTTLWGPVDDDRRDRELSASRHRADMLNDAPVLEKLKARQNRVDWT